MNIKKGILLSLLATLFFNVRAQIGVSLHHSEQSFAGVNYTYKNKFIAEVRVNDRAFLEPMVGYFISSKDKYVDFYGGMAYNEAIQRLIFPIGINIYPITKNQSIGFHVESTIQTEINPTIRGSLGIRYLFRKYG